MAETPFDYGKRTDAEESAFMDLYAAVVTCQKAATRMYALMGRVICLERDDPHSPYLRQLTENLADAVDSHRLARAGLDNARLLYEHELRDRYL